MTRDFGAKPSDFGTALRWLFGNTRKGKKRTALIVLITPAYRCQQLQLIRPAQSVRPL